MLSIILIGVSLAMDAFAVSVSSGLSAKGFRLRHALLMGLYFGGFQFMMPLAGYFLAGTVSDGAGRFGSYISFALLAFIGGKMIYAALKNKGESDAPASAKLGSLRLLALAFATSIDAFAVGVSFVFTDVSIFPACAVIGIVTFIISFLGGTLGKFVPRKAGGRAEIAGGLILIIIGIKLLVEGFAV